MLTMPRFYFVKTPSLCLRCRVLLRKNALGGTNLPKIERLLRSCSLSSASGHSVRRLIGLKHRSHFKRCIRDLSKHGIKPVKSIPGSHVICCHVDKRRMKELHSLTNHPSVKYVEPDFKISAHGLGAVYPSPRRHVQICLLEVQTTQTRCCTKKTIFQSHQSHY